MPFAAFRNQQHATAEPPRVEPDQSVFADTEGKAHRGAGRTERAAARKVRFGTGTQKRLIYDAIAAAGDQGLIDEEIAVLPGVKDTAHRTRRNELVKAGVVKDSGRTRLTDSGTESIIWVLA